MLFHSLDFKALLLGGGGGGGGCRAYWTVNSLEGGGCLVLAHPIPPPTHTPSIGECMLQAPFNAQL